MDWISDSNRVWTTVRISRLSRHKLDEARKGTYFYAGEYLEAFLSKIGVKELQDVAGCLDDRLKIPPISSYVPNFDDLKREQWKELFWIGEIWPDLVKRERGFYLDDLEEVCE